MYIFAYVYILKDINKLARTLDKYGYFIFLHLKQITVHVHKGLNVSAIGQRNWVSWFISYQDFSEKNIYRKNEQNYVMSSFEG
jgi:hypothetical protein